MTPEERIKLIEKLARDEHQSGDGGCKIDNLTEKDIFESDNNGCYVRAWLWVDFFDTPLDKEGEQYKCDNCQYEARVENFPEAKDLSIRLTPGGKYTDVECPECGALAFPVEALDSGSNSI